MSKAEVEKKIGKGRKTLLDSSCSAERQGLCSRYITELWELHYKGSWSLFLVSKIKTEHFCVVPLCHSPICGFYFVLSWKAMFSSSLFLMLLFTKHSCWSLAFFKNLSLFFSFEYSWQYLCATIMHPNMSVLPWIAWQFREDTLKFCSSLLNSWPHSLIVGWIWPNHLTSVNLGLFPYQMEVIVPISLSFSKGKIILMC